MFLFVLVYVYFNSDPNVPFITSSGSTSRPLCCSRQSLGGSELCYLQISAVRLKELAKTLSCKLFFPRTAQGFPSAPVCLLSLPLQELGHLAMSSPAAPSKHSQGQQHQAATRCRFPFTSGQKPFTSKTRFFFFFFGQMRLAEGEGEV